MLDNFAYFCHLQLLKGIPTEWHSGSVIEYLTRDRGAVGMSLDSRSRDKPVKFGF